MALFQASVLNTYLKLKQEQKLGKAFKKFSKYFYNPAIQKIFLNSKEEWFQAAFLTNLFVNVLGYKLNPQPDFNLSMEFKKEQETKIGYYIRTRKEIPFYPERPFSYNNVYKTWLKYEKPNYPEILS